MKLILIIFTTFFALTFSSPISSIGDSSSILNNLSQLLHAHISPIFQNTFKQLTQLVDDYSQKYSDIIIDKKSSRSNPAKPAEWVYQLFNGSNSIESQWNNHITDFFANIQTVYENDGRSLFDLSLIKLKLHIVGDKLIRKLKQLIDKNIEPLLISIKSSDDYKHHGKDLDILANNFQREISNIFDNTKKEFNQTIDDLIDSIFGYWNSLKDRLFG